MRGAGDSNQEERSQAEEQGRGAREKSQGEEPGKGSGHEEKRGEGVAAPSRY